MAASRSRTGSQQPDIDIRQIIAEAQTRWLRPVEVCEILKNYATHGFRLNPVPPVRPCNGSMFLFDRKTLRYFRKDGHNWRKKKDGKTVREAHERLKTGSVDVLHCYYAHGEDNSSFQRRCYWMLDPALEHIVLVHYREVTEGGRFTMSDSQHSAPATHAASPPDLSNRTASPEMEEELGDHIESEDAEEHSSLERIVPPFGPQDTLLDQLTPRAQAAADLNNSPVNGWIGGDLRGGSVSSNLWLSSSGGGGSSSLESLLDAPTGLTPKPGQFPPFPPNKQQLKNNSQFPDMFGPDAFANGQRQESFSGSNDVAGWRNLMESSARNNLGFGQNPGSLGNTTGPILSQNAGGSLAYVKQESMNGATNWAEMLEQCATPSESNDVAGWRNVMETNTRNNLGFGQYSGSLGEPFAPESTTGPILSQSAGGSLAYVKQESMNGATNWAEMLAQCTTPSTTRNVMESLMANNRTESMSEPPRTQDIGSPQVAVSKGILEALSPRGLGREPQTALEASLQAVTQEKALKAAGLYQRRLPGLRSESQSLDLQFVDKKVGVQERTPDIEAFPKLDSFGRWMSYTLDGQSFLSPGAGGAFQSSWPGTPTMGFPGLADDMYQMQVDTSLSTSVSSDQRYSITDSCPEWAYASEGAKVLISGSFLGDYANATDIRWHCMFGEVEVPAEVINGGVLRCKAPPHAVGRVSFYVTCGDRQAHSEIRDFEYRSGGTVQPETKGQAAEERLLKFRLAHMLLAESESESILPDEAGEVTMKRLNCLNSFSSSHSSDDWLELEALAKTSDYSQDMGFQDRLLQMMFKSRMQKWLLCKIQEEGKGPSILDAQGQGVFHMAAALGYDWVVAPMVAAGVPIDFRDAHGWTALHWAASCGKEQVVITLVGHGADSGAVTDPTPSCPSGQTPADLAVAKGYVGIGGWLAESSLTRRISMMTLAENPLMVATARVAGETAVANLSRRDSIKQTFTRADDQASIRDSLQAVRNAARAAALIQAAFRQHSFRKREEDELASEKFDEYGMTESQMRGFVAARAAQRIQKAFRGHNEKKQQLAASRIQQKFRSWKVRKDFVNLRQRVVTIQAHVRGNLVRRRFRKILWSVGILEKAILRWKRKRSGLRGFKSGDMSANTKEDDDEFLKEGRKQAEKAVEKAVTTVTTMVRSQPAREQYRRLREGSLKAEQLGQFLPPSSPQDLPSSPEMELQSYEELQNQHMSQYLSPLGEQLLNIMDS